MKIMAKGTIALRFIAIFMGLTLLLRGVFLGLSAVDAAPPDWTYWVGVFPLQFVAAWYGALRTTHTTREKMKQIGFDPGLPPHS